MSKLSEGDKETLDKTLNKFPILNNFYSDFIKSTIDKEDPLKHPLVKLLLYGMEEYLSLLEKYFDILDNASAKNLESVQRL